MAVPSTAFPLLQMSALARVEGLRHLEVPEINKALDAYADTYCSQNAGLTERERICRLANRLMSIKDLTPKGEIREIVSRLRRAFDLQDALRMAYSHLSSLVEELSRKHPVYGISEKLRTHNRFIGAHDVAAIKAETALMVSDLLVIGMNADGEDFLKDLNEVIREMTKTMLTWM